MTRKIILTFSILLFTQLYLTANALESSDQKELTDTSKVVSWITQNAIPITSLEFTPTDNEDLNKIGKLLKDKKIIGLGDASHGTKEFFLLKQRIIEYSVNNLNCSAIAMEIPIDVGVHLNNFVKTGEGDIDELLNKAWWWHRSEEIKSFLIWLRDYNAKLPENKKVSFYGFDCQVRNDNTYQLFQYLKKVDDNYTANIEPFHNFIGELYIYSYDSFTPWRRKKYDVLIESLKAIFDENKENYIEKTSREEYLLTKARLNIFATEIELMKHSLEYSPIRAKANAETIKTLSEIIGNENKLILWAHNGHIASDGYVKQELFNYNTANGFYDINTIFREDLTGFLVRQEFGDKYFNIGFEFHSGNFTAIEFKKRTFEEFTVSDPDNNSLPYLLNKAQVDGNSYFIELNKNKMDKTTFNYFNTVQYVHEIGASYVSRYVKKTPITSYNAIIYFRNTSAAKLLGSKDK